jgi:hypothetical protein
MMADGNEFNNMEKTANMYENQVMAADDGNG